MSLVAGGALSFQREGSRKEQEGVAVHKEERAVELMYTSLQVIKEK